MALVRFVGLPRPAMREALTIGAGWRQLGYRAFDQARRLCPVGDSDEDDHLRDKLQLRFVTGTDPRILIGAQDPRCAYVINGTEPHPIDPVNASVLVFTVDGQTVFARHVDHPGTQPNNFILRAFREVVHDQAV